MKARAFNPDRQLAADQRTAVLFARPHALLLDHALLTRALRRLSKTIELAHLELVAHVEQKCQNTLPVQAAAVLHAVEAVRADVDDLSEWQLPSERPPVDDARLASAQYLKAVRSLTEAAQEYHASATARTALQIIGRADQTADELAHSSAEVASVRAATDAAASMHMGYIASVCEQVADATQQFANARSALGVNHDELTLAVTNAQSAISSREAAQEYENTQRRSQLDKAIACVGTEPPSLTARRKALMRSNATAAQVVHAASRTSIDVAAARALRARNDCKQLEAALEALEHRVQHAAAARSAAHLSWGRSEQRAEALRAQADAIAKRMEFLKVTSAGSSLAV